VLAYRLDFYLFQPFSQLCSRSLKKPVPLNQPAPRLIVPFPFYVALFVALFSFVSLAQTGVIDPSFNVGTGLIGFEVNALAVQNDGKLIVGVQPLSGCEPHEHRAH
jgi:hypothetical protein